MQIKESFLEMFDIKGLRRKLALALSMVLFLSFVPLPEGAGGFLLEAKAADESYYVFRDGHNSEQEIRVDAIGGVYNLTNATETMTLYKYESGSSTPQQVASGTSISFNSQSMELSNSVAYVQRQQYSNGTISESSFLLTRKGFGFQTISGIVTEPDGSYRPFSFRVKVDLKIDRSEPQYNDISGNKKSDFVGFFAESGNILSGGYSLRMQYPGVQQQFHIQNYSTEGNSSGWEYEGAHYEGLPVYDYSKSNLIWSTKVNNISDDYSVAVLDGNGEGVITAVGAGTAVMTVENDSQNSDEQMSDSINVIVPLLFSVSGPAITGTKPGSKERYTGFSSGVTYDVDEVYNGKMTLYTTAFDPAKDLSWEITNAETGAKANDYFDISALKMSESGLDMTASKISITGHKAGKYRLVATVKTTKSTLAQAKAELILTIPVDYSNQDIWMNVGDKYNLFNNTNIPNTKDFIFEPDPNDTNVLKVNNSNGVITAKRKGIAEVYVYPKEMTREEAKSAGKIIICTVHVLDTLQLSTSDATIPVGGMLDLTVETTDVTRAIIWTVEDDSIVSIEEDGGIDAVITGLKAGETTVTATQKMANGVEKSVSCTITVVSAITKVEIKPTEAEMNIDDTLTLKATVTPQLSSGVELYWVSSDESIVSIDHPEERSSTCSVTAKSAGTAVVMAINKQNVVVGSCKIVVLRAPDSIKISESSVTVPQSAKRYQLYASLSPSTATNQKVIWKSTNTRIASVDENGLVTFNGHGTVSIIVTSDANPALTDMCELTITEAVSSLILDQTSLSLDVGDSYRLTYEVLPATAFDRSVSFVSMDPKVATVNSTGLITAKKAGTTYITVTTTDGGFSKVCTVTVRQNATTIKLDASGLILDVGEGYNLQVSFNPKTTTETTLKWSSNDPSVAKVDTKGRVTGVGAGTCIITVTTSNNLVAFCYVTVNQQVTGIELNFDSVTVDVGKFVELEATVLPDNASNPEVEWSSSNEKIAKVSDNGTVQGIMGGSAIITCKTIEGDYTAVCMVIVMEQVAEIKLNKSSYKLGVGKKFTLKATVTNTSASDQSVTWISNNPDVCSVNQKGVISGLKLGNAVITAYANDGSDAEASCEVRVVRQATSLTLNKNLVNLVVGDSETVKATIKPSKATYKKAKFKSSDTSVALVDSDGKITAVGAGTCNITASAKDSSGLKAVCVVIVRPVVAATAITLNPSEITMGIGGAETINYSLRPIDSTDTVKWSSNNQAVATVGKNTGIIKAVAPGTAVVTATTSSGRTGQVRVTVVGLNYYSLDLEQYDTYQLRVMGVNSGVVWDVDNPDICTVAGGRVTAKRAGTTTVVARVNGAELRCRVTVRDMR